MPNGAVVKRLGQIFDGGTVAGLGEGQLLERYLARRDEAAFEALVARHGPMVLGVCRRVLRDPEAAEDAFQATFLVLIRKAAEIQRRDLLAPWLHAVATRTALRARSNSIRRRQVEGSSAETSEPAEWPSPDHSGELRAVLDEEVARLPEKYRAPVVLCYFEGKTHDEAAVSLGWPVGTVRGRLARARDQLRGRLTRRGLAPAAGVSSALLASQASGVIVPPALASATVRAALGGPAGWGVGVSASAVLLSREVARSLLMTKLTQAAAAALTIVGVVTAGAAVSAVQRPGDATPAPSSEPVGPVVESAEPPPAVEPAEPVVHEGVVEAAGVPTPEPAPVEFATPAAPTPTAHPSPTPTPGAPTGATAPIFPSPTIADPASVPPPPSRNGAFQPPPPPPGHHYEAMPFVTNGRNVTAYVLVPDAGSGLPAPVPRASDGPEGQPSPVEPLPPQPVPNVPPVQPSDIPPPPREESGTDRATSTNIREYLERTRLQVDASIETLTQEQANLKTRLGQIDSDLADLKALQEALANPGREPRPDSPADETSFDLVTPPESLPDGAELVSHNEPPLEILAPDVQPATHRAELPPLVAGPSEAPFDIPTGPSTDERIGSLESKLDRLIQAMEGLRREIESIKESPEPPSLPE